MLARPRWRDGKVLVVVKLKQEESASQAESSASIPAAYRVPVAYGFDYTPYERRAWAISLQDLAQRPAFFMWSQSHLLKWQDVHQWEVRLENCQQWDVQQILDRSNAGRRYVDVLRELRIWTCWEWWSTAVAHKQTRLDPQLDRLRAAMAQASDLEPAYSLMVQVNEVRKLATVWSSRLKDEILEYAWYHFCVFVRETWGLRTDLATARACSSSGFWSGLHGDAVVDTRVI